MRRFSFTLIEVLIAILLLTLISGLIGAKMYGAIEKKRFHSSMGQLKERLLIAQKMAIASGKDWIGTFEKDKQGWIFSIQSEENQSFRPIHFEKIDLFYNGRKIYKPLQFHFFASGYIDPRGKLSFQKGADQENISLETFWCYSAFKKGS